MSTLRWTRLRRAAGFPQGKFTLAAEMGAPFPTFHGVVPVWFLLAFSEPEEGATPSVTDIARITPNTAWSSPLGDDSGTTVTRLG